MAVGWPWTGAGVGHRPNGNHPRTCDTNSHSATRLPARGPWLCGPASRRVCSFVGLSADPKDVPRTLTSIDGGAARHHGDLVRLHCLKWALPTTALQPSQALVPTHAASPKRHPRDRGGAARHQGDLVRPRSLNWALPTIALRCLYDRCAARSRTNWQRQIAQGAHKPHWEWWTTVTFGSIWLQWRGSMRLRSEKGKGTAGWADTQLRGRAGLRSWTDGTVRSLRAAGRYRPVANDIRLECAACVDRPGRLQRRGLP